MISKISKNILWLCIICLSSYFLLQFVKDGNKLTIIGGIAIYIYFFILLFIGYYFIIRKLIVKIKTQVIIILFGSAIAVLFNNYFLQKNYEDSIITITALDEKNNASKGCEVWITDIRVNNCDYDISDVDIDNKDWVYNEELDRVFSTSGTLQLQVKELKTIHLTFLKHSWSGKALITFNNTEKYVDLYSKVEQLETISFEGVLKSNCNAQKVITFITLLATFFMICMLIYGIVCLRDKN